MSSASPGSAPPLRRAGPVRRWSMPVTALLLGLFLGLLAGWVFATLFRGDDSTTSAPASSPAVVTPAPPTPGDVAVTGVVPVECLQAADEAAAALGSVDQGLTAVRDVDAAALRTVLQQLQDAQPRVQELAAQCRSRASATLTPAGSPPTGSPPAGPLPTG